MTKRKAKIEHGQRRRLGDLKPHPQNPRIHTRDQIEQIAASMGQRDWTQPIIIDEFDVILAGHGRAAGGTVRFGEDYQAPVSVITGWSDEEKLAYVIADNRLSELASWDVPALQAHLIGLEQAGYPLLLTGYTQLDLQGLGAEWNSDIASMSAIEGQNTTAKGKLVVLFDEPDREAVKKAVSDLVEQLAITGVSIE